MRNEYDFSQARLRMKNALSRPTCTNEALLLESMAQLQRLADAADEVCNTFTWEGKASPQHKEAVHKLAVVLRGESLWESHYLPKQEEDE